MYYKLILDKINKKFEAKETIKMIYNNILDLIGNTPVVKLNFKEENIADIYLKLE